MIKKPWPYNPNTVGFNKEPLIKTKDFLIRLLYYLVPGHAKPGSSGLEAFLLLESLHKTG